MDISVFMDISLQLSMLLWVSILISLDLYGNPRIDLLWILGPGDWEISRAQKVYFKHYSRVLSDFATTGF